jgi:hypothetical protein
MSSHKPHQRGKQRGEHDKARPAVQQSAPARPAGANGRIAPAPPPHPSTLPNADNAVAKPANGERPPDASAMVNRLPDPSARPSVPPVPETESGAAASAPVPAPKASQSNGDTHSAKHTNQRTPTPPGELSEMFATLRALFVQDRANAARPDATRCGICYLTFPRDQLVYREAEGYYACPECLSGLNGTHLPMLRRQRK